MSVDLELTNTTIKGLIDENMFEDVSKYKWYLDNGYIVRSIYNPKTKKIRRVLLHRIINNTPKGMETDHINGIRYDNRRCNLRTVTRSQNMFNRKKHKQNTSGFRGISWDKVHDKWKVCLSKDGKVYFGGRHILKENAVKAAKRLADKLYGAYHREVCHY